MTRSRDVANIDGLLTAKGDIYAATAAATPDRLGVGANGESLVADSSTSTGLRYTENYAAGKNKIINGAFDNWQRGTSFTITNESYTSDRFKTQTDKTGTVSRQTFTAGTAPVAGYEGQFYLRSALNAVGSYYILNQMIENVQTFAGQTVTVSYWARVSSGTAANAPELVQNFGSGGSASVTTSITGSTITTDWQRFTVSVAVPSVTGKTIGTSSALEFRVVRFVSASAATIDIWGVQVEDGSVATAFQTASGSIQGELAACQRYYQRITAGQAFYRFSYGGNVSATQAGFVVPFRTSMRTIPTFTASGNFDSVEGTTSRGTAAPTLSSDGSNTESAFLFTVIASGAAAATIQLRSLSNVNTYIDFSAEL